jgi:hypothetical protein
MNSDLKRVRDGQASDDVTSGSPVLKKRSMGTPPRSEVKSEGMTGDWMEVVEVSLHPVFEMLLSIHLRIRIAIPTTQEPC